MAKRMGYKEALDWLLRNDDIDWLDDRFGSTSVATCLVADIYKDGDADKVTRDLKKRMEK